MTDEEKKWWEEEKQRLAKAERWLELRNSYAMLVWEACAYASPAKKTKFLDRWPMEELSININKWFDDIRDADAMTGPYTIAKNRLFQAFSELAESRTRFLLDDSNLVRCPICQGDLTSAFNEPMVCERCMKPVLDALDDLVRASTTEWTPEQLRKLAGSYFEV